MENFLTTATGSFAQMKCILALTYLARHEISILYLRSCFQMESSYSTTLAPMISHSVKCDRRCTLMEHLGVVGTILLWPEDIFLDTDTMHNALGVFLYCLRNHGVYCTYKYYTCVLTDEPACSQTQLVSCVSTPSIKCPLTQKSMHKKGMYMYLTSRFSCAL